MIKPTKAWKEISPGEVDGFTTSAGNPLHRKHDPLRYLWTVNFEFFWNYYFFQKEYLKAINSKN